MMNEFFARDYSGGAFILFSPPHLAALAVVLLVNLSLLFLRGPDKDTARQWFRYGLAGVLILNEAAWHIWHLAVGTWTVQTMLPLHLCSVFVYLSALMLVRRDTRIYEFAYLIGIAGATQALLTPDLGIYGFPHFRYWQTFISHGGIVTAAVYMTVVEGCRPYWRSFGKVALWTNVYMVFVGIVNALIGSNYLFVAHKPETASLLDMLGPWPWYLLAIEAIGFVVFLLLYLPFAIGDLRSAREINPA
jgi:hypothetical integral membrane protein (TIGR02206 family)